MNNLSERINNLFIIDQKISLKRGGPYYYLRRVSTKINGKELKDSIEYRISDKNKKRVTLELIESIYNSYNQNGIIQERFELNESFKAELKSRPCNYSVAKFIVEQLIKEDEKNHS
jgi:hypothetical protein